MKMNISGRFNTKPFSQEFSFTVSGADMGEISSAAHTELHTRYGKDTWHESNTLVARDGDAKYGEIYFQTLQSHQMTPAELTAEWDAEEAAKDADFPLRGEYDVWCKLSVQDPTGGTVVVEHTALVYGTDPDSAVERFLDEVLQHRDFIGDGTTDWDGDPDTLDTSDPELLESSATLENT